MDVFTVSPVPGSSADMKLKLVSSPSSLFPSPDKKLNPDSAGAAGSFLACNFSFLKKKWTKASSS